MSDDQRLILEWFQAGREFALIQAAGSDNPGNVMGKLATKRFEEAADALWSRGEALEAEEQKAKEG